MLSSLSHDLRTPLASILGASTSLLSGRGLYDEGQTHELLSTVREEAERLDRFVGNLLDMSRLEAGVLGVKLETSQIGELVDMLVKRLARRLSGHRVVLDLPDDLPLVLIDPLLFEQAVANILDNAAKYAPPGSTVHVHGKSDPTRVTLSIEDEGPGLPHDDLPHIFDKFYRAKAADRRVAGTGLGLAVARGFVEAFGGTLDASNRKDRSGADLTMTLPIAPGRTHGL
jgi:two-component system sensor histidine kinase KdpD